MEKQQYLRNMLLDNAFRKSNHLKWFTANVENINQSHQLPVFSRVCMQEALTIGGKQEVCSVLLRQPSNLIDLLLNLQTLKIVEFGLMALKGAVDIVLSLGEGLSLALWKGNEREKKVGESEKCACSITSMLIRNCLAWTPHSYNDTLSDTAGTSSIYQPI